MEFFRAAKHGTVFQYHSDLSGVVYVQLTGEFANPATVKFRQEGIRYNPKQVLTVQIPSEDLLEFMSHITSVPAWDPERDPHDKQTSELMVAHVQSCATCSGGTTHCEEYWRMLLGRAREREKLKIQ